MNEDEDFNQFEEPQDHLSQRNTEPSEHQLPLDPSPPSTHETTQTHILSQQPPPSNSSIELYNQLQSFQFENNQPQYQFQPTLITTKSGFDVLDAQMVTDIHRNNSLKQTPFQFSIANSYSHIENALPFHQPPLQTTHLPSPHPLSTLPPLGQIHHQPSNTSLLTNFSSTMPANEADDYFLQKITSGNSNNIQLNAYNLQQYNSKNAYSLKEPSKQQIRQEQQKELLLSYETPFVEKQEEEGFSYASQVKHTTSIIANNQQTTNNHLQYNLDFITHYQPLSNTNQQIEKKTETVNAVQEEDFEFVPINNNIQQISFNEPVHQITSVGIDQVNQHSDFIKQRQPQEADIFEGFGNVAQSKVVVDQVRKQSEEFEFQQQKHDNIVIQPSISYNSYEQANIVENQTQHPGFNITPNGIDTHHTTNATIQEDQFGDFQQSEQQNTTPSSNPIQQKQKALNIVQIKEEYLNSHQAQYYQSKKAQLQAFVDNLPDYSFILAHSFTL